MCHRGLKPANVLLDMNIVPNIADFGISRLLDSGSMDSYVPDRALGTVSYMDPEYAYIIHVNFTTCNECDSSFLR